jgi:alpha-1,3-mannosyltransferase
MAPPLRVLHVTSTFYPSVGGIERFIRDLAVFAKRAADVESTVCVCTDARAGGPDQYEVDGIPVFQVRCAGPRLIRRLPDMSRWAAAADIVHLHDPQIDGIARHFARRRYGPPVVLSTHGGFFHTPRLGLAKSIHYRLTVPRVLRGIDLVIANSANDEAAFAPVSTRLIRIPNGVDFDKFNAVPSSGMAAPRHRNSIVYFGRLVENKRVARLIECVGRLRERAVPAHLEIVGGDATAHPARLKAMVADQGLQQAVRFHGELADEAMLGVVAGTRFFASASTYEGFGMNALEAMAAGRIVLLNAIAPFQALVREEAGFAIDFDSVDRASDRIAAAMALPAEQLDAIARNAIARAREHAWEARVHEFLAAYEQVLELSSPPRYTKS